MEIAATKILNWFASGFFAGTGAMLAYAIYAEFWGRIFPGLAGIR